LLLFNQFEDTSPTINVNRWLLAGVGGTTAVTLAYVVREAYLSRKQGPPDKVDVLAGMIGTVTGEIAPRGIVLVENETWTAISEDDSVISIGESVVVRSADGLILTVFRRSDPDKIDNS
jgi:membrane protein implicated in regulation of membrane protease activity